MVREHRVESFYSKLRDSLTASSLHPLIIFPSTSDVDSLCALKIIFQVLQSDFIRYSCHPVSSYQEIHNYVGPSLISSSSDPISILLINWGCHRDLRKFLNLGSAVRVFVVDSHRPIHLHNLSDQNQQVVVLYTKDDELGADLGYDFDVSALANASDLNSDDEIDEEWDSETDDDPVVLFRKLKMEYYHKGTFHGKPSGCLMYDLSHSLRKNTNELLWLACVSLTDQFVHERLTDERYKSGVMELEQYINSSGNLNVVNSVTLKDGTKIRARDASRITYDDEPKLTLLQEWNLFDSMLCSSYIATAFKTWSDNGMNELKLLLAHMGFALVDCRKEFQFMNFEVKRKMKDEFKRNLGLTDFYYRSFMRSHGYSSKVSAADVVYGVTALLESFVKSDGSSASEKFGVAYDALLSSNLDNLKSGMQQAIKVQRTIFIQGSSAITKSDCIKRSRKFCWVKIEDSVHTKLLGYPQALTKFCYFIMDALSSQKKASRKPPLCASISREPNKVLIVGVCEKPRLGASRGNAFGRAFRKAAKEISGEFFHEMFESSWIVVDATAVDSFMDRLREKL